MWKPFCTRRVRVNGTNTPPDEEVASESKHDVTHIRYSHIIKMFFLMI